MKPTEVGQKKSLLPLWACVVFQLLIVSGMGIMSMYFGAGKEKLALLSFLLKQPKLIFLNLFPLILLAMLIWLLTNRPWIGTLTAGVICLAYSWAEYWKLMARDEPIYAEDLTLIREAAEMSGRYISFTWQNVLSLVLVVCSVVFMVIFFRHTRIRQLPLRLGICGAAVLAGVVSWVTLYTNDTLYASFDVYGDYNYWIASDRYLSTGSLYPFLHTIPDAIRKAPEGYSTKKAEALLDSHTESDIPEDRQVSVVCIMFEAMADFSKLTDAITEADPYAQYHALEAESYSGQLAVNIFGGGTIDTERCALTGFWTIGSFRTESWSYARYFQDQGYTLNGAHAGESDFYSRSLVNQNLGFDNYRFRDNYYDTFVDGIAMDDVFLPDITEVCLEDMESGPVFSYNVTYQNHGPYSTTEGYFDTEYVSADAVDSETYYMFNNYLSGVESTWESITDMVDAFEASEEPVVLVLFGDHMPWMGDQNSGYDALGIDMSRTTVESYCNYYTTDYIIWANDAAKEVTGNDFSGTGPTISPCYLMNLVFQQCGWDGPAYMKLTDELMELLPVTSTNDTFPYRDRLITMDELDAETSDKLLEVDTARYYLEYKYLKGK